MYQSFVSLVKVKDLIVLEKKIEFIKKKVTENY